MARSPWPVSADRGRSAIIDDSGTPRGFHQVNPLTLAITTGPRAMTNPGIRFNPSGQTPFRQARSEPRHHYDFSPTSRTA
jgi:hypothetical protein